MRKIVMLALSFTLTALSGEAFAGVTQNITLTPHTQPASPGFSIGQPDCNVGSCEKPLDLNGMLLPGLYNLQARMVLLGGDLGAMTDPSAGTLRFDFVLGAPLDARPGTSSEQRFVSANQQSTQTSDNAGGAFHGSVAHTNTQPPGSQFWAQALAAQTSNITSLGITFSGQVAIAGQGIAQSELVWNFFLDSATTYSLVGSSAITLGACCHPLGQAPGSSPSNPTLPSGITPHGFTFTDIVTGAFIDPPTAWGFHYEMTSDSLFTSILGFPPGFADPFVVSVGGVPLGQFLAGQSVDFGAGVSEFSVTGLRPLADGNNPLAFPLQFAFNTSTASFEMQAIGAPPDGTVPEPAGWLMLTLGMVGLIAWRRRPGLRP